MVNVAGSQVSAVVREEPHVAALKEFDRAAEDIRTLTKAFAQHFDHHGKAPLAGLDAETTQLMLTGHYGLGSEFGNGLNVVSQLDFMLPEDRVAGLREMMAEPGQLAAHAKEQTGRGDVARGVQGLLKLSGRETKLDVLQQRVGLMERWAEQHAPEALPNCAALRGAVEALEAAVERACPAEGRQR